MGQLLRVCWELDVAESMLFEAIDCKLLDFGRVSDRGTGRRPFTLLGFTGVHVAVVLLAEETGVVGTGLISISLSSCVGAPRPLVTRKGVGDTTIPPPVADSHLELFSAPAPAIALALALCDTRSFTS